MGCDIHMVLEEYCPPLRKWVGIHGFKAENKDAFEIMSNDFVELEGVRYIMHRATRRNYQFFGELAGVRGESSFGYEAKGMPDDASDLARMEDEKWGQDGHSHSWHLLPDFLKCYAAAEGTLGELVAERLADEDKEMSELVDKLIPFDYLDPPFKDYRVVFWFDN